MFVIVGGCVLPGILLIVDNGTRMVSPVWQLLARDGILPPVPTVNDEDSIQCQNKN